MLDDATRERLEAAGIAPYFEDADVCIIHGDCRDVLPHLGPVDLVLTDPPYGVGMAYLDEMPNPPEFVASMKKVAPLVAFTCGVRNLWAYPKADWVMAWAKPAATGRNDTGGFNHWEPVLLYGRRRIWTDLRYAPVGHEVGVGDHPSPKPIALFRWLVEQLTDTGGTILDPFMGSGTTLRAAKDLGRKAIGIEIEERYCAIAAKRMAQGVLC